MTKFLDPNAPVTRLPSFAIVPDLNNLEEADFFGFPQLTQDQIDSIPEAKLLAGIVVYNTTYNVYMGYTENRWNNINTSLTYKGGGYEAGSPFAIPFGLASDIEPNPNNQDPGVMYITSDTEIPKIYANGVWNELAIGGGSSTFNNITITGSATINDSNTVNSTITTATITDANIVTEIVGTSTITTANITNANIINDNITNATVTNNLNVNGIGNIGTIRAGIDASGAHTQGAIAGLSAAGNLPEILVGLGTAAGVGATAQIFGSTVAGTFSLTTGTSISGTELAQFTLPDYLWQEYTAPFAVIWTHLDSLTFQDSITAKVSVGVSRLATNFATPAQFTLFTGGVAQLSDNTSYNWQYVVIGNVKSGI